MRTPEQIALDHRAAEMRSRSLTYQQIGDQLGMTRQAAHQAVQRAIAEIPKEGTDAALHLELDKLDLLERQLFGIMGKKHLRTSTTGKVVEHEGSPVYDDGPVINAISGLLKVGERRARLLGLNAPTKVSQDVTIYDVERDTAIIIEAQLRALRSIGLDDAKLDQFRNIFVAAIGSGDAEVVDAEWSA
jgi:hypothetical protein